MHAPGSRLGVEAMIHRFYRFIHFLINLMMLINSDKNRILRDTTLSVETLSLSLSLGNGGRTRVRVPVSAYKLVFK